MALDGQVLVHAVALRRWLHGVPLIGRTVMNWDRSLCRWIALVIDALKALLLTLKSLDFLQ